ALGVADMHAEPSGLDAVVLDPSTARPGVPDGAQVVVTLVVLDDVAGTARHLDADAPSQPVLEVVDDDRLRRAVERDVASRHDVRLDAMSRSPGDRDRVDATGADLDRVSAPNRHDTRRGNEHVAGRAARHRHPDESRAGCELDDRTARAVD